MKTNLDKLFKTSQNLEANGVWFEVADGVAFLVRPFKSSNPKIKAALAAHYKPYAKQIAMDALDEKKNTEIQIKLFVSACLVDWKGVVIDGEEQAYSPELATEFFMSLPELFTTLWAYCNDFQNYREDLGNS